MVYPQAYWTKLSNSQFYKPTTNTRPEWSTSLRDDKWLNSSKPDEESPTQEGLTTRLVRIRISLDHKPGEDEPNRINRGLNNNNNSNRDRSTTSPTHHDPCITMSKYQWTCLEPEPHITNTSIRATTPTRTPPNRSITTPQTSKDNPTTNDHDPKDPVLTVER